MRFKNGVAGRPDWAATPPGAAEERRGATGSASGRGSGPAPPPARWLSPPATAAPSSTQSKMTASAGQAARRSAHSAAIPGRRSSWPRSRSRIPARCRFRASQSRRVSVSRREMSKSGTARSISITSAPVARTRSAPARWASTRTSWPRARSSRVTASCGEAFPLKAISVCRIFMLF